MPALDDLHGAILAAVSEMSQSREIVGGADLVGELRKVGVADASELIALRMVELEGTAYSHSAGTSVREPKASTSCG
jgi:hypothetical protein